MRVRSASYIGPSWRAITFYSEDADVYKLSPPSVRPHARHVAHVQYSYGGNNRGLDVYLLNHNNVSHNHLNIKKIVRFNGPYSEEIDKNQNIKYELVNSIKGTSFETELINLLRFDIDAFCEAPAAEKFTEKKYSDIISPVTKVRLNHPKNYLTSGKHDFVKSCLYRGNLDFSTAHSKCVAGFVPGDNLGLKSSFDGETFTNFFDSFLDECMYCYAGYQHDAPFPKTLIEIDKDKLEYELRNGETDGNEKGQIIKVLRLGKRTEVGSIYTRKQLFDTLETILRTGTHAVMPTKSLEFNKDIAELFKRSGSSILYSEGDFENVQSGLVMHGHTQEFRKEQARLYREEGVKTGFFLLIAAPQPPTSTNLELMEYARKHDLVVQLLPTRIPSREVAYLMLGKNWENLKGDVTQHNFDGETGQGGYILTGNGFLTPKYIHPDWLNLIGDNKGLSIKHNPDEVDVRMCHHHPNGNHNAIEYCGGCIIGKVGIKVVKETKMIYTKKPKKRRSIRSQHKMEFN